MARKRADVRATPPAPPLLALDTSCLVALVCGWHEHHAATLAAVDQRLDTGFQLALAAPALLETYCVLTRLPAPHRLSPIDALQLLRDNFQEQARTVVLGAEDYWALLRSGPDGGIYGGRTYDAVIAACARKARVQEILTLNLRHFESFADSSLLIRSPLSAAAGR